MKLLKRILGICETPQPSDSGGWSYAEGILSVQLERMPELRRPGGAVRLEGGGLPRRILVVRGIEGAFHAFSNRCTHMGRRLDPLFREGRLECCSVSRSTFTYTGEPVSGAAKTSLETFSVMTEGDALRIPLG